MYIVLARMQIEMQMGAIFGLVLLVLRYCAILQVVYRRFVNHFRSLRRKGKAYVIELFIRYLVHYGNIWQSFS